MELFYGRPEANGDRLPREIRTYDFLDNLGITYQRTDHEFADNMEACMEIDKVLDVMERFLPATGHTAKVVHLVGED